MDPYKVRRLEDRQTGEISYTIDDGNAQLCGQRYDTRAEAEAALRTTLQPFATWAEVLAHVGARQPIWYQAPLDYRPVRVRAVTLRRQRWTRLQPTEVRVYPSSMDCDPFWADAGHLDRFRRRG